MLTTSIPVFPLPDTVLFPGVFLPLHIFEMRYREMIRDCLAGDRLVGVSLLKPGWDRDLSGRPPIYGVGCVGLISHVEELSDGRYNLVLRGMEKYRVVDEEPPLRAYRRATVAYLSEQMTPVERDAVSRQKLRLERLLSGAAELRERAFPPNLSDEEVINALAQYLDLEPIEHQALLEQEGVARRGGALIELLEMKAMAASHVPDRGVRH
ncbi:MAG TPA: LON peptidase substrate-binding domain-containing protein [Vicinamibacterales bacterium]|nr:LON peptidase substrate-binding domain-containing protein [Vicinamibacterales bacterium]